MAAATTLTRFPLSAASGAAVAAAAFALAACGGAEGGAQPGASVRPTSLILTAIPDDSAEDMREHFGAVARAIEAATGIPTRYLHVENYAASVTALATGQVHFAWLGAVTTAQAWMLMKDELQVVACRDIDKGFVSYFIAHEGLGLGPVADLSDLAAAARGKGWLFTFGSKSSTSSHLMPRSFFAEQSGAAPEEVFRTVAYSGSHDVVLQKVANGEFHVGALGQPPYERASPEVKARAPVVYVTPGFTNYCLTASRRVGEDVVEAARAALLGLHETEEGRSVLGYLKAGRFVEAGIEEWMGYVRLIESGVDIGG